LKKFRLFGITLSMEEMDGNFAGRFGYDLQKSL
jgi:hypothetical protein